MNATQPIIDVMPVAHSSSRNDYQHGAAQQVASGRAGATSSSQSGRSAGDAWRGRVHYSAASQAGATPSNPYFHSASPADQVAATNAAGSILGGMAQIAVGAGLVLIGIPMLILPGPGLLSIAGGMALAANGARKLLG